MFFFFFKQKTAYEMRISDWSSDVCSSDLLRREIDRLFEDMGGTTGSRWLPAADIREDDNAIDIDVELPGIDPENVDINVDNGIQIGRASCRERVCQYV